MRRFLIATRAELKAGVGLDSITCSIALTKQTKPRCKGAVVVAKIGLDLVAKSI